MAKATFGAGCFWHPEDTFRKLDGVTDTAVGFAGGTVKNPSYEQVCRGGTGHAEVVHLEYDPDVISYERLLDIFFDIHDPTQKDRQGLNTGRQYRSAIFYHDESQKQAALRKIEELEATIASNRTVATEVSPFSEFYRAEEYHQQYVAKRS